MIKNEQLRQIKIIKYGTREGFGRNIFKKRSIEALLIFRYMAKSVLNITLSYYVHIVQLINIRGLWSTFCFLGEKIYQIM